MNQYSYIAQPDVQLFTQWIASRIESDEFAHSWLNRRSKRLWSCKNLYNAFQHYKWSFNVHLPTGSTLRGEMFSDSTKALNVISSNLQNSVISNNDEDALEWCIAVMQWGGVFQKNGIWLKDHKTGLAARLRHNTKIFSDANTDNGALDGIGRFNSGMSKIYSLLVDDFIIYDTRVAATLGWFVTRFCIHYGLSQVPHTLQFPYGIAKEGANTTSPKQRNPSLGTLRFPFLSSGLKHAKANLWASWLLQQVLKNSPNSKFQSEPSPLRALEAALFMFGYDLGTPEYSETSTPPPKPMTNPVSALEEDPKLINEYFRLKTRGGKHRIFGYRINSDTLIIENINNRQDVFGFKELYSILTELYREFGTDWFPLANNVQKMGNGTERPGLGCTILRKQPSDVTHAQAASYLGRIFEDIGLAQWNGKTRGIAWKLLMPPPPLEELAKTLNHLHGS